MIAPVVAALQKHDGDQSHILNQFLSSFDSSSISITLLSQDQQFPLFLQFAFDYIIEHPITPLSKSLQNNTTSNLFKFLSIICMNNPDLLACVASLTPFDKIIQAIFQNCLVNGKIEDPRPVIFSYPLQFLASVSQSSSIHLTNTATLETLYSTLLSLFGVSDLLLWVVSIIAGTTRNSPAALGYIQSTSAFPALKKELAQLLSSSDNSLVIASLSALVAIFGKKIDVQTAVKCCLSAVTTPLSFPLANTLAASVLLQISDSFSKSELNSIFSSALKCTGMQSYVLFKLLSEISAFQSLIKIIAKNINKTITFLSSEETEGFVCVAAVNLIQSVFDTVPEPVTDTLDVHDSLSQALNSITKSQDLSKIESLLFLVRLLPSIVEGTGAQSVGLLNNYEEALFTCLQRHTEMNNDILAINFFLFIYDGAKYFKHWYLRLREIVIDTQFSSLVAHVLSNSQNRHTLQCALEAIHYINCGISGDCFPIEPTLSSTILNGFVLMNQKKSEEELHQQQENDQTIELLHSRIEELEVENECNAKELERIKNDNEQSISQASQDQDIIRTLEEAVKKLSAKLKVKREQLQNAMTELELSESEIQNLQSQIQTNEQSIYLSESKAEKMKKRIESLRVLTEEKAKLESEIALLKQKLDQKNVQVESLLKEIEDLQENVKKEKAKKKKVDQMLTKSQDQIAQLTAQLEASKKKEGENARKATTLYNDLQDKTDHDASLQREVDKLQVQISALTKENQESSKAVEKLNETVEQLSSRIRILQNEKAELVKITELICRITDEKVTDVNAVVSSIQ